MLPTCTRPYIKVFSVVLSVCILCHISLVNLEIGDIKASVAVLSFILSSAAKHDVDSESLSSELQQLGLPKGKDMHVIIF